jgi:hypothetical protein
MIFVLLHNVLKNGALILVMTLDWSINQSNMRFHYGGCYQRHLQNDMKRTIGLTHTISIKCCLCSILVNTLLLAYLIYTYHYKIRRSLSDMPACML